MEHYYTEHKFAVSFSHGDFTPWNVCYNKDDLFVFDFEYAQKDFPVAMDVFHYLTQVGILMKNAGAEEIFQNLHLIMRAHVFFWKPVTVCSNI